MYLGTAALSLVLAMSLSASAANAQQCSRCLLADACIKQYSQVTAKIQKDYKKAVAEQRRGREQQLGQRFSERAVVAGNFDALIDSEIEKLKDCLTKIR
jgi:hypothetical protein